MIGCDSNFTVAKNFALAIVSEDDVITYAGATWCMLHPPLVQEPVLRLDKDLKSMGSSKPLITISRRKLIDRAVDITMEWTMVDQVGQVYMAIIPPFLQLESMNLLRGEKRLQSEQSSCLQLELQSLPYRKAPTSSRLCELLSFVLSSSCGGWVQPELSYHLGLSLQGSHSFDSKPNNRGGGLNLVEDSSYRGHSAA
jgi:hypothetical protein